ncbi:hypothetical protein C8F04DRAFT_1240940 [Mycena alexandri]|uniref:Uncharacterized protein n=1 Tax=Mycena alexandri TaxID=1745969 RepID=A0AAD6WV26_9AGAR|nr:hypothetical protein C8F04DRAFT_1240940 [Mycena alexandri]
MACRCRSRHDTAPPCSATLQVCAIRHPLQQINLGSTHTNVKPPDEPPMDASAFPSCQTLSPKRRTCCAHHRDRACMHEAHRAAAYTDPPPLRDRPASSLPTTLHGLLSIFMCRSTCGPWHPRHAAAAPAVVLGDDQLDASSLVRLWTRLRRISCSLMVPSEVTNFRNHVYSSAFITPNPVLFLDHEWIEISALGEFLSNNLAWRHLCRGLGSRSVQLHTLIEGGRDVFELISDSEPEPDSEVEVGTAPIRPSSRASSITMCTIYYPLVSRADVLLDTDDFNLSGQSGTDDFRDGASDVDDHGGNVNPIVEHGMDRFQFILNGHHFQDDSDKDDPRPSDTLWEDDITSSVRTGRFTITQKIKVQRLECLSEIPSIWPIPRISTAFVIDLDNDKHNIINPDTHGSRSYHPKCGQRCLEVSPGSPWSASPLHINPELLARVAAVSRFELDPSSRTAGLAAEAETRRNEGTTPEQHAAMQVVHIAYRKRCTGGPILKAKPQGFSRGHMYFVACSGWNPKFKDDHRTHQIPDHVDENLLARFLAGMTIADGDEKDTKPCSKFVHPRTGFRQHFCPHSHIKDGQQVRGKIIQLTCTARRAIYVPVDTSIRKALIVHNDTGHNHPMPTLIKASFSTKETYKKLLQAVGVVGATVSKVDNDAFDVPRCLTIGPFGALQAAEKPPIAHELQTRVSKVCIYDGFVVPNPPRVLRASRITQNAWVEPGAGSPRACRVASKDKAAIVFCLSEASSRLLMALSLKPLSWRCSRIIGAVI